MEILWPADPVGPVNSFGLVCRTARATGGPKIGSRRCLTAVTTAFRRLQWFQTFLGSTDAGVENMAKKENMIE